MTDSKNNNKKIAGKVIVSAIVAITAGVYLFTMNKPEQTEPVQIQQSPGDTKASTTGFVIPGKPAGPVILTVNGAKTNINAGAATAFDRAMLRAFPQVTHRVTTPWTDGETDFTGPLLIDVLHHVGAEHAAAISATALNSYQIEIPVNDARQYQVILALQQNGKELGVRDKGPVWVIYPWTPNHPELKAESYHSRSIWQLSQIGIK